MKEFEVWSEGYRATGEGAEASLLGTYTAETFDDAVAAYLSDHPQQRQYYGNKQRYAERSADGIMQVVTWHTIWACRLFDNEADARKSFG